MGIFDSIWMIIALIFFLIAAVLIIVSVLIFLKLEIMSVIGYLSGKTEQKQVQEIRKQTANSNYSANKKAQVNHSKLDDMIYSSNTEERAIMQKVAHASKNLNVTESSKPKAPIIPSNNLERPQTIANDYQVVNKVQNITQNTHPVQIAQSETTILSDDSATSVLSDESTTSILTDTEDIPTELLSEEEKNRPFADVSQFDEQIENRDASIDAYDNNESTTLLSDDNDGTTILSNLSEGTTVLSNEPIKNNIKFVVEYDETEIHTDEVI